VRCLVLVLVATIGVRSAGAETAAELFQQGLQLMAAGKPAEACAKLDVALKLEPDRPGVLLNLGLCNAQQNKLATALSWFRRAHEIATSRAMAESQTVAMKQITALSAKVPTIKIAIVGDLPRGATVTIDGTPIAASSYARLEIDAGRHTIGILGAAVDTTPTTIDVADVPDAKQPVTLHVKPAATTTTTSTTGTVVAPAPVANRYVVVDRGASRRRTAMIIGGVGAGLLVVETTLGLIARNRFDSSHDLETRQRWKDIALYGSTSMFAVGAAAVGAGVVLYFTAPGKERVAQPVVTPVVSADGAGLSVGGRF
jgi:hypothetical protein